jgi:pilus assembly protein Flp/PilA
MTGDEENTKDSVSLCILNEKGLVVMKYLAAARKFVTRQEEGATLAEYGLLLALIAVVCITAIAAFGSQISTMFQSLSTTV